MTHRFHQPILLLATGTIGLAAACSSVPPVEHQTQGIKQAASEAPPQTVAVQNVSAQVDPSPQDDGIDPELALESPDCTTWNTYRASLPEPARLPNMPPRFENGCLFGTDPGDRASLYVLPEGITLGRVFDEATLTSAPRQDGVPYPDRSAISDPLGFANELIESGNAMIFSYVALPACARFIDNVSEPDDRFAYCDFASPHRAYSVWPTDEGEPTTTCFGYDCLKTYGDIPVEDLLALWEPWRVPTPNPAVNDVRSQYEPIDLNTLPELRRANLRFEVEALLIEEFGRTTLEEGEQPTVISPMEYTDPEYSWLNVITVTNDGSADDSVGGVRYRFEFEPFDGDTNILVWAGAQRFCRRTQQWTNQTCP
ncbi:MAG: hypothetical protein ACFB4J_08090 [Elainellaceae cyanobacterium]